MIEKYGKTNLWLTIGALVFYAHATSVCVSIRYGFLADAFGRKNVPGKVFGLVGTSMAAGYVIMFVTQLTEKMMRKWNSKTIMASNLLGYAIVAFITGFSYSIPNTTVVIAISFVMRIIQGLLAYTSTLVPVDFINAHFPDKFDMVNGLLNMGFFSGHGMAEVLGSIIYDHLGYAAAYGFSAVVALTAGVAVCCFIPKSRTYLSSQTDQIRDNLMSENVIESENTKLSKFLILPMVATMLINANYGVLQVSVTPFLKEQFNKSISYGGAVLTLVSVGMCIGSLSVGILLQKRIVSHFTAMAIGALCVCFGLLVTFPPEFLPTMYHLSPITAFPAVFIAGVGDPLMTIATLKALYDIQLQQKGVLKPKTTTTITAIWVMGYCCMYFSGAFIAGTLTDYLSYSETAEILAGFCLLSTLICIAMRYYFTKDRDDSESTAIRNMGA